MGCVFTKGGIEGPSGSGSESSMFLVRYIPYADDERVNTKVQPSKKNKGRSLSE